MQLANLESVNEIVRKISASLDLDQIYEMTLDAAMQLVGTEAGLIALLDEKSGKLRIHISRNIPGEVLDDPHLMSMESQAGRVFHTAKPLVVHNDRSQRITSAYSVNTIVYMPLVVQGRSQGVLGLYNHQVERGSTGEQLRSLAELLDLCTAAVSNALAYAKINLERMKLEAILLQSDDGIMAVDYEGRIAFVNQVFQTAFNHTEDLKGKLIRNFSFHSTLQDVFSQDWSQQQQHEITVEDGRVFIARLTPVPEVGFVFNFLDITYLKELDRIKSDFVNSISHDLRSPLTAILGYVELIERSGPVSDQQREFIQRVQMSVSNITSLVNDLLELERIEVGYDTLKETVSLLAVLQETTASNQSRLSEKLIEMVVDVSDELPAINGNLLRLEQMIGNLISNSIKYTPPGGKIILSARRQEDQVIIQVQDNGLGIPLSDQPFIFDRFYRAGNVPFDTPGTGLGLAIVKTIVENHHGRIWVDSSLGVGTTFTVVLPTNSKSL